ncbi:MAG: GtrA family protein [Alphaproteobacteria bacterium]|nr:GtrA family protein [Alphaproteobacteria bacterium]
MGTRAIRPRRIGAQGNPVATLRRQFLSFAGVGLVAAVFHYGVLIGLVETRTLEPVGATLCGFIAGGIVSYALNRNLTFCSDRPHRAALPRFLLIAAIGFVMTGALMALLHDRLGLPYVPAQFVVTGAVLLWTFTANRLWTFRAQTGSGR